MDTRYLSDVSEGHIEESHRTVGQEVTEPKLVEIGSDNWHCDGRELTPRMRKDILATVADLYEGWRLMDGSYEFRQRELEWVEHHVLRTVWDLFGELTGERNFYGRAKTKDYGDDFFEWLNEYLHSEWGDGLFDDDELDPLMKAEHQVEEWVGPMCLDDLAAWKNALSAEQ